jgi:hypothetical protein
MHKERIEPQGWPTDPVFSFHASRPLMFLPLDGEAQALKILAVPGQLCLQFGDFDIFLDVILKKRRMLLLPRFQQFLGLAHTSHQVRLFVDQQRIARVRSIRMECLCPFALLFEKGAVLLIQWRLSIALHSFGKRRATAKKRALCMSVPWQFASKHLESTIPKRRRRARASSLCSTRWDSMRKQPNLRRFSPSYEQLLDV